MPRLRHLLRAVPEQHGALPQRRRRALQQRVDVGRVRLAQAAALVLHPPAGIDRARGGRGPFLPSEVHIQLTGGAECMPLPLFCIAHTACHPTTGTALQPGQGKATDGTAQQLEHALTAAAPTLRRFPPAQPLVGSFLQPTHGIHELQAWRK